MKNLFSFLFFVAAFMLFGVFQRNKADDGSDRPELSSIIFEALTEGRTKIDIPKGKYSLELKNGRPMVFENLHDVEINGNGSDVLCRVPSQIISVRNCSNLKIKGFSFDSIILPYTQGTVVAKDTEKGAWLDIEIHEGYEKEMVVADRIQFFDPKTHHLKRNFWTIWGEKIERQQNGRWRMIFNNGNGAQKIEIGELVVLGTKSREPLATHSIVLDDSKHCVLEDITLYFSNCFSYLEHGCHGNKYLRCRLIKKKDDPARGFPRLRSGNADSFHSKFATLGPHIENCEFWDHGDDCVAINGNFYLVVTAEENRITIFERHGHRLRLEVNDPVRFTSFDGKILGDAKILSVVERKDFDKNTVLEVVQKFQLHGGNKELPPHHKIYELRIDKPVGVEGGGNVYALNRIGNGFVVRNNKMGFTRARGILVKCGNGEIVGNTIVGCELGGIVVAPELYWLEAGYSENLLIENNIVRNCSFHADRWGDSQSGTISVVATTAKGAVMQAGAMKNITVKNNTISDSPYPALLLASTDEAWIQGNTFSPPKEDQKREHGKRYADQYKLMYDTPIWQINNKNVEE